MSRGPCEECEELLQGYLDRELDDREVAQAEKHLDGCEYCRRRYRFELSLRKYVRTTAVERMPAGLMEKLVQLRSADGPTA
ncbi:putative zinc-finger [Gaiella occulta]|uniref:Putative zinc-finger n=1 Tax=Gaiella occulta TaxID=1002870 RepID=A0A7M2Z0B1_9ACTN|nr:anti-sigma factor [Gaiella occulta]RDI75737.1 putative zinc-finger [Gaiella occulta]